MKRFDNVVSAVRWLLPDAEGTVVAWGAGAARSRGALEPGLAEAVRAAASSGRPCAAAWRGADGGRRVLAVWGLPGLPGALAVDTEAWDEISSEAIATLVNNVAHDVRNFAFTVALQGELAERRADLPPDVKAHLGAVLRQIDTLKAYLDRLLLFGRPLRLAPGEVEVARFVRELTTRFKFAWEVGKPPLAISVDVAPECGAVRWDGGLMAVALEALLDNAARASDPPPAIEVTARREGGSIVLEVADHGPGMAPETLAALGMPMAVRRAGGAGLGVAIARKVVHAHGGAFEVTSNPPGTTVRLVVPSEVLPD